MKTVFVKPRFRGVPLHRLYYELEKHPPKGYKIVTPELESVNKFSTLLSKTRGPFYKKIMYHVNAVPYILYQLRDGVYIPADADLIYAAQHVITTEKPWVVDVEFASALSGYCDLTFVKKIIENKLKQKNCKKILAWSDWSKRTILQSFNNKSISEKIQVVRYTTDIKKVEKRQEHSVIRLLFMGTVNVSTMSNFEYKGIYETIGAFVSLQKEYGNRVQLIIKSKIPEDLRDLVAMNKGITLIEEVLTPEEVQKLYMTSGIFPHVGYETMNFSVLEAMSYGLPVIATDIFNTPELIQEGKNGFLIKLPNVEKFYTKHELPNEYSLSYLKEIRKVRSYVTQKLTEKIRLLIEDSKLREQIGSEARRTIAEGEFSLQHRNELLRNIFDEATGS